MASKITGNSGKKATIPVIVITAIFLLLLVGCSYVDDSRACQFEGAVELDGAGVTDDTVITAVIDGDEYNTYTPSIYGSSRYCLLIEPPEGKSYPDGEVIIFKINGYDTKQSGRYKAGSTIGLDLAAYTGARSVSINPWMVVVMGAGLIMCIGLICFLLHLDRLLKKMAPQIPASGEPFKESAVIIDMYLD